MFQDLSQKLEIVFKKLRGHGKITGANIADALREVRRALLDADVNYKVAKQFIDDVQKRAVGQEVLTSITPGQLIIKIIHDELIKLLGESSEGLLAEKTEITFAPTPPTSILVAGLQGSGKTTFAAKLARYLKGKGHYPMLVAADTRRPAAVEQLKTLGNQIQVPVYCDVAKNAVQLASESIDHARKAARDVVIIDTAGRLHVDEEMMQEIETIKRTVNPHEILFVVDSMTGQDAVNTAKAFHDRLDFTGVVLTKLDGDTRGGAALSIRAVVDRPIKFASVGEKLDALEPFHPDRMASRILGMGDIVTLVEKAHEQFDQQKAQKLEAKLLAQGGGFTFEDFLDQLREIKKLGSIQQVMDMIPSRLLPGNRSAPPAQPDDKALTRLEAMITSMTKLERTKPQLINGSRRRRIAQGSGTTVQEVNKLLRQFEEMKRTMKHFSKKSVSAALKRIHR